MLRLAFDFIIAWREIRARPNAYSRLLLNSCFSFGIYMLFACFY